MQSNNGRLGWREAEEALLFDSVREARKEGRPLKAVFEEVARQTGRKANSIRNYYYAKLRADETLYTREGGAAFVPFGEEEIDALLREVLTSQAKGISVRACTLSMGHGDTKAMLRYQNKYRSVIKNDPARVKRVLSRLEEENIPACDPYERKPAGRVGRPSRKAGLVEILGGVVSELDQVEGLDVTAFFESLGALALSASRGAKALENEKRTENPPMEAIAMRERLQAQEKELHRQRERFNDLLSLYRRMLGINRQFLAMTGVSKMSSLSGYIHDLSRNVEDCERALPGLM